MISRPPFIGPDERARSFAGAAFALYLSAWTLHWSGGPLPSHVAALDAALTITVLFAVWKLRLHSPLAPLGACYAHLALQEHLVRGPRSAAEWGATFVTLGFFLLAGSLATSYRLRTPSFNSGPRADDEVRPDGER